MRWSLPALPEHACLDCRAGRLIEVRHTVSDRVLNLLMPLRVFEVGADPLTYALDGEQVVSYVPRRKEDTGRT